MNTYRFYTDKEVYMVYMYMYTYRFYTDKEVKNRFIPHAKCRNGVK